MVNPPMAPKHRIFAVALALLSVVASAAPVLTAHAATYGSDNYGGGPFNTGVDPAPAPPPPAAPSEGGGVVIGGPLGIGFVVGSGSTTTPAVTPIVPDPPCRTVTLTERELARTGKRQHSNPRRRRTIAGRKPGWVRLPCAPSSVGGRC